MAPLSSWLKVFEGVGSAAHAFWLWDAVPLHQRSCLPRTCSRLEFPDTMPLFSILGSETSALRRLDHLYGTRNSHFLARNHHRPIFQIEVNEATADAESLRCTLVELVLGEGMELEHLPVVLQPGLREIVVTIRLGITYCERD